LQLPQSVLELEGEEFGFLHHEVKYNWPACFGQPLQDDLTGMNACILGPVHFRCGRAVYDRLRWPKQRRSCCFVNMKATR
jgi:hypothetical protein